MRNGTGAESESFYFIFVRITKMRAKHSTKSLCFEIILLVVYKFDEIKVGVEEGEGGGPTPWLMALLNTGSRGHHWGCGILSSQGHKGRYDRLPIAWGWGVG